MPCLVGQALEDLDALSGVGLGGVRGPGAGVAVGLQFQADGEVVGVARVAFLLAAHLRLGADQVLDVVAVFVGQHVRLRELAGRSEPVGEHVVEAEVDVDLVVGGAVERADAGVGLAAAGVDGLPEDHRVGGPVDLLEARGKRVLPVILDRVDVERVAALQLLQLVRRAALLLDVAVVGGAGVTVTAELADPEAA